MRAGSTKVLLPVARATAALSIALALSAPAMAASDFVEGEVLVRYRSEVSGEEVSAMEARFALSLLNALPHLRLRHYRLPEGLEVDAAIEALQAEAVVESVDRNVLHSLQVVPNDPRFSEQWSLHNTGQSVQGITGTADSDIDWPEAMDLFAPIAYVTVAVIDTGVAIDHPEILSHLWVNVDELNNGLDDDGNGYVDDVFGWNFIDGSNIPLDDKGHGTQVASVVGAIADNATGGTGVHPGVRIMPLRVGDEIRKLGSPIVSLINFLLATTYAAQNGADLINFSAGRSGGPIALEEDQLEWLDAQGILFIAAAGNGGEDQAGDDNDSVPTYPASYATPNIISVAATDQDDQLTSFSNYGLSSVDLAAPGSNMFAADISRSFALDESFEFGAPGWTVGQNCFFGCPSWSLWSDALSNTWASDGSFDFFGTPLSYSPFTDSWLTSPAITLGFGPVLFFREWHALDFGDFLQVQISTDGINWADLFVFVGFSYSWAPGTAYGAGSWWWADLTGYEGFSVQLRFRLTSDSAFESDGVYIDDIRLSQVETFSYDGTQYTHTQGTSFSAPLVAGVAALLIAQRPDLGHHEIRQAILASADPLPSLSGKMVTGGRLNARAALAYVPEPSSSFLLFSGCCALLALRPTRRC